MSRIPSVFVLAIVLILTLPATIPAQERGMDPTELGRLYTTWFYDGDFDELWPRFATEFTTELGGEAGLRTFRDQVRSGLGEERELLDERVEELGNNVTAYIRTVEFEDAPVPFIVVWALAEDGTIVGFQIVPDQQAKAPEPAPTRFADYETLAMLRLPFSEEWFVFWGGRTTEENYHVIAPDQRFAYDMVVIRDMQTHTGDGTRNEEYHCFGLEILAPGYGEVVVARDGIPDNAPGVMDAANPPGNYVVLDHGNSEYSFLAHLQEGSVRVAVGDRVTAGTVLGLCGNSGHSSEPHLHYHLQTTPDFGAGEGLPAQFVDYISNGESVERGEPTRGELIRPAGRGQRTASDT